VTATGRVRRIDPLLRSMTEAQWQRSVIGDAALLGWDHLHVRKSRGHRKGEPGAHQTTTNHRGWPDLLLWNRRWPDRHVVIELKRETGSLETHQKLFLPTLAAGGFEVYGPVKPRHADEVTMILSKHPDDWPPGWVPSCRFVPEVAR
jgi:hypothetical protein